MKFYSFFIYFFYILKAYASHTLARKIQRDAQNEKGNVSSGQTGEGQAKPRFPYLKKSENKYGRSVALKNSNSKSNESINEIKSGSLEKKDGTGEIKENGKNKINEKEKSTKLPLDASLKGLKNDIKNRISALFPKRPVISYSNEMFSEESDYYENNIIKVFFIIKTFNLISTKHPRLLKIFDKEDAEKIGELLFENITDEILKLIKGHKGIEKACFSKMRVILNEETDGSIKYLFVYVGSSGQQIYNVCDEIIEDGFIRSNNAIHNTISRDLDNFFEKENTSDNRNNIILLKPKEGTNYRESFATPIRYLNGFNLKKYNYDFTKSNSDFMAEIKNIIANNKVIVSEEITRNLIIGSRIPIEALVPQSQNTKRVPNILNKRKFFDFGETKPVKKQDNQGEDMENYKNTNSNKKLKEINDRPKNKFPELEPTINQKDIYESPFAAQNKIFSNRNAKSVHSNSYFNERYLNTHKNSYTYQDQENTMPMYSVENGFIINPRIEEAIRLERARLYELEAQEFSKKTPDNFSRFNYVNTSFVPNIRAPGNIPFGFPLGCEANFLSMGQNDPNAFWMNRSMIYQNGNSNNLGESNSCQKTNFSEWQKKNLESKTEDDKKKAQEKRLAMVEMTDEERRLQREEEDKILKEMAKKQTMKTAAELKLIEDSKKENEDKKQGSNIEETSVANKDEVNDTKKAIIPDSEKNINNESESVPNIPINQDPKKNNEENINSAYSLNGKDSVTKKEANNQKNGNTKLETIPEREDSEPKSDQKVIENRNKEESGAKNNEISTKNPVKVIKPAPVLPPMPKERRKAISFTC